jgi:FecR protein
MNDEIVSTEGADSLAEEVKVLFRVAGRRPRLPDVEVQPIKREVRAAWRNQVQRRARRTWGTIAALAAGCLLVVGLVRERLAAPPEASLQVARLEMQTGEVGVQMPVKFTSGSALMAPGSVITTGAGGRAALRLHSGPSLRLDVESEVAIESEHVVALHRGSLYVDAVPGTIAAASLEIVTPFATVRHVGTQFEARLLAAAEGTPSALRVRVREGAVVVRHAGSTHEARAGQELLLRANGTVVQSPSAVYGSSWEWTQRAAPAIDIEGLPLATFLAWVARETSLPWRYADAELDAATRGIVLHGSIAGLTPEEALSVVLPGCALRHRVGEAVLILERR